MASREKMKIFKEVYDLLFLFHLLKTTLNVSWPLYCDQQGMEVKHF